MNIKDQLRQEFERRRDICKGIFERDSDTYYQGKAVAYDESISIIDSLSEEEPSKDLEEAAEKHINEAWFMWSYYDDDDEDGIEQSVHDAFIAGAEWGAKHLK